MEIQFEQFLKEKCYLKNCSEDTLAYFKYCFKALTKHLSDELSEFTLKQWIVNIREAGKTTGSINSYIRGINFKIISQNINAVVIHH